MKEKKYLTLYQKIKNKIINGDFQANEKLPSKRVMADQFGCSVITVEAAYDMLADEGYIEPQERSGYYVCEINALYPENLHPAHIDIDYLEQTTSEEAPAFEYSLWFKTIRKVISEQGDALFVRSPNKGCAILRNAIADYLYRYRGMLAQPRQIIIGSGAEQLYETVLKLLGRELIYGIENPSYPKIEMVYSSAGVTLRKLEIGQNGIEHTILQESDIDVLHVTPFRSYPTDITIPVAKRHEYLHWAKEHHYIVEDDYNSEFFLPGQPVETLYSLDSNETVIYINTFSKSLSPSMRMGYMILPEHLISTYEEKLGEFSCTVPVLDQYILAEYISSGNFERHLNRERRRRQH